MPIVVNAHQDVAVLIQHYPNRAERRIVLRRNSFPLSMPSFANSGPSLGRGFRRDYGCFDTVHGHPDGIFVGQFWPDPHVVVDNEERWV